MYLIELDGAFRRKALCFGWVSCATRSRVLRNWWAFTYCFLQKCILNISEFISICCGVLYRAGCCRRSKNICVVGDLCYRLRKWLPRHLRGYLAHRWLVQWSIIWWKRHFQPGGAHNWLVSCALFLGFQHWLWFKTKIA